MDRRRAEVIDAPYFHVVFTLPHELNPLIYANQKALYGLFHRCLCGPALDVGLRGAGRREFLVGGKENLLYFEGAKKPLRRPRLWLFTQQHSPDTPMDKQWVQDRILKQRNLLGVDGRLTAHSFRHAFATHSYENGMDLLSLKTKDGQGKLHLRVLEGTDEGAYKLP